MPDPNRPPSARQYCFLTFALLRVGSIGGPRAQMGVNGTSGFGSAKRDIATPCMAHHTSQNEKKILKSSYIYMKLLYIYVLEAGMYQNNTS